MDSDLTPLNILKTKSEKSQHYLFLWAVNKLRSAVQREGWFFELHRGMRLRALKQNNVGVMKNLKIRLYIYLTAP